MGILDPVETKLSRLAIAGATASGARSFAMGSGSTASGADCIAIGQSATASNAAGSYAFGGGNSSGAGSVTIGPSAIASGNNSTAAGYLCNSSAQAAFTAGESCSGSASYTTALGQHAAASRVGQLAHAGGRFAAAGDAQASQFVMRVSTTTATPTELGLDGSTTYLTISSTRTMAFRVRLAAHRTDVSGTAAAWPQITGGITRDATGNCRLLGSVTGAGTTALCDAGASTWSVAVTADATNNRLAVTVTGEAAKTIRWVAVVDVAEVG